MDQYFLPFFELAEFEQPLPTCETGKRYGCGLEMIDEELNSRIDRLS
jgi:hypothetical protein